MGRQRALGAGICVAIILGGAGCKEQNKLREDEKLKVVVAEDRAIAQEESSLLNRRGALTRERTRIRDKRVELITQKMSLAEGDAQGKEALEAQESELVRLEAKLANQEVQLNKRLRNLLDKKSGLVGKLGAGESKALLLQRREYTVAMREKDLGRRESDIARREKHLAEREQSFAARQARLCPRTTTTVVQTVPAPRNTGRSYSRKDVEPVYEAALSAMRTKGILTADLPGGVDRMVTETRHAVAKKDYARAKFAADQLLAAVRAVTIDRSFIGAKISRLSKALRRRPARGAKKTRVASLFQQATAAYGDGRFREANSKLNTIYGLLR